MYHPAIINSLWGFISQKGVRLPISFQGQSQPNDQLVLTIPYENLYCRAPPPPFPLPLLLVILLLYLPLAVGYSLLNPFEAPDEHWHYFTVNTSPTMAATIRRRR
jgi:hypothetical protein